MILSEDLHTQKIIKEKGTYVLFLFGRMLLNKKDGLQPLIVQEVMVLASDELRTSKLTEVAELLGTSYRHLNRVIRRLCFERIIERNKGALFIKDREKIKELASGNIYE